MKKLFTLAVAVFTALTMNAQSTVFLWQYDGSTSYGDGNNGVFDVAADATNGTIKFVTYEGKKTSADGTSGYDASVVDNDLKPAITKVCKLGNNGAHLRISPANGTFQAGDSIFICGYKEFIVSTSSDPTSTAKITTESSGAVIIASALATGSGKSACKVGYVVLPNGFVATNEIYISRANGSSAGVAAIKVVRPEQKTIVSTVEELINAKVNNEALDPNFLSELIDTKSVEVLNAYTTAPTVTFTKHVVITYEDESIKESDVDVEVVAEALGSNQWTANITLNGADTYLITMQRATAYTVTYKMMDGDEEIVLGTELVAAGEHPAEYAQYEVRPLCAFNGWIDEDYIEEVDLTQVVVNSDMSFYADFVKAFAQSIDFEQMVLNQGVKYDVKSALTEAFYDYKDLNALDSLNNDKGAARNEPYLGLKIKKKGGYLACNVLPGTTIRIKFGYVGDKVLAIAGTDTMTLTPTDNKIADQVFPIMVETLVKLQTTSDKTVVIKQIMVDESIVTWMYPINYAETENGKVEGWTIAFPNETVTLTATPNAGYVLASITVDGEPLQAVDSVYSFVMPAQAVEVAATFESDGTAIDNTDATAKTVKVLRDGVLFIEKNGVRYNAQGAVVR